MLKKKSVIPVLIILCLCLFLLNFQRQRNFYRSKARHNVQQKDDEVEKINRLIKLRGYKWKAGKTSVSKLTPEERRKLCGSFVPTYIDPTKFVKVKAVQQPSTLDWSSKDGYNWLTSVKHQGLCGSCWTFGVLGIAESMWKVEQNRPNDQPDLSEQHLLSCSGGGDCDGGYASDAAEYTKTNGVPPESCFPYQASDVDCDPCLDYPANASRINYWGWITQGGFIQSDDPSIASNTAIVNELQDGPLAGFMTVYDNFYYYTGDIYEYDPAPGEEGGGHFIVIVGYNMNEQYWICKNSWGTDWGEDGYFKIKWDTCDMGTWVMKITGVSLVNQAPVLSYIGNQTTKEGEEFTLQLQANDPDDNPITYSAAWNDGALPDGAEFDTSTGLFEWTPTYTQAGTYSNITFTISDGLATDSETIAITVENVKKGKGKH